jgi:hypothetical protein
VACHAIIDEWIEKAKILIPINSILFLISEPTTQCNHIISCYGFDTILYSLDLREHLINELRWDLGLDEREYDDEDGNPAPLAISKAIQAIKDGAVDDSDLVTDEEKHDNYLLERRKAYQPIPYWEEVILYCSSGWGSIGLKFPYEKYAKAQPIVVADNPTVQKTFE